MMVGITERVRVYNPRITDTVFMIKQRYSRHVKREENDQSPLQCPGYIMALLSHWTTR